MKKYGSYIVCFLIGFVLFMVGNGKNSDYKDAAATGYKVEAVITDVKNISPDVTEDRYAYYGDYELNGKSYTGVKLGETHMLYQVGDKYSIVVNPEKPGKEMGTGFYYCFFGVLIMVLPVYVAIKEKKKSKKAAGKE